MKVPSQLYATADLSQGRAFDAFYLVMLNTELMLLLLGNGSEVRFIVRSKVVVSAGYRTVCLCVSLI